jgi:hypothetical protein
VAVLATAESSEAPKQQQQRRGRAPRTVTVPIADVQPGQEYEGTVVRGGWGARAGRRPLLRAAPPQVAPTREPRSRLRRPPLPTPPQTSVEAYGAFVSIGSDTDGLVHVSQLSVRRGSGLSAAEGPGGRAAGRRA